ncbi:hypothetical protein BDW62DRAFT_129542 [Aspergillus aurantiobrunneus]
MPRQRRFDARLRPDDQSPREAPNDPRPTAVIVDIKNDAPHREREKSRRRAAEERDLRLADESDYSESSDSNIGLSYRHRRPRANVGRARGLSPPAAAVGARRRAVDRGARPLPAPARDYDLVIDQRLLERNDQRQDLELLRQQQEIERLERKIERLQGQAVRHSQDHSALDRDDISLEGKRADHKELISGPSREPHSVDGENRSGEEERNAQLRRTVKVLEAQRHDAELEEARRVRREIEDREAKERVLGQAVVEYFFTLRQDRQRLEDAERQKQLERMERDVRARLEAELGHPLGQVPALLASKDAQIQALLAEKEARAAGVKVKDADDRRP